MYQEILLRKPSRGGLINIPEQTDHSANPICPLVVDCCPLWLVGEAPTCRTSTVLGRNQLGLDLAAEREISPVTR